MSVKLLFLLISVQYVTPVFIRSGQSFNQNNGQAQDSNFYDQKGQKGATSVQEAEGYNKDGQQKIVDSQEGSRYGQSSGVNVGHSDRDQYNQNKFKQDAGHQEHEIKKNIGHKKGHHKSGFHNSYHKDESGSNSSYYDDAGDEGNQYVYDGRKKKYDGSGSENQQGQNYDNKRYNQDQAKHGVYDNRGNVHNDRGDRGYYNQRQHYDDREQYAKNLANDRYNHGGVTSQNKYYDRPHYTNTYDPYYYDRYPRYVEDSRIETTPLGHSIKIYEDPRYVNNAYRPDAYRNGYARQDVRPHNRYDNGYYSARAPRYDYY